MATKKTTTKTSKSGNTTTKIVKDSSKMTGRQQLRQSKAAGKREMSKNAQKTATTTAIAAELGATAQTESREKTKREQAKYNAYGQALAKWNGILPSTPTEADGTNPGMQGSNGSNNIGDDAEIIWG